MKTALKNSRNKKARNRSVTKTKGDYADSPVTRNRRIKKKLAAKRATDRSLEPTKSVTKKYSCNELQERLERFEKY